MKKKFIILFLILVLIVIFITIFINTKKLKIDVDDNKEVNIYEEVTNLDLVNSIKNGNIVSEEELIDTNSLGEKEITLKIRNFFKKVVEYKYNIIVVDKEKPVIEAKDVLETVQGKEIDLLKDVIVTDNSKEEIIASVEGEYDINKVGDYTLYYVAKDSSGNEEKKEFILKVKEKEKVVEEGSSVNKNVSFTTSKGFKGITKNGITYIDGYLVVNKTYSLPANYNPGLNNNVATKAEIMFNDAKKEGLNIYLSSGFRSYSTQKNLYNRYVTRDGKSKADTYSARAGHSEHQSGLAFDVNQINSTFDNTKEAIWLSNNCYKYGFILRYPKDKTNETGYKYESWHFRYVGVDLATKLYNNGNWITLESYFGITSEYNY